MSKRWVTERKTKNKDNEILSVIEVYAEKESEGVVHKENKHRHHEKRLLVL